MCSLKPYRCVCTGTECPELLLSLPVAFSQMLSPAFPLSSTLQRQYVSVIYDNWCHHIGWQQVPTSVEFFLSIWFHVRSAIQKLSGDWKEVRNSNLCTLLRYTWATSMYTFVALYSTVAVHIWDTAWEKPKKNCLNAPSISALTSISKNIISQSKVKKWQGIRRFGLNSPLLTVELIWEQMFAFRFDVKDELSMPKGNVDQFHCRQLVRSWEHLQNLLKIQCSGQELIPWSLN